MTTEKSIKELQASTSNVPGQDQTTEKYNKPLIFSSKDYTIIAFRSSLTDTEPIVLQQASFPPNLQLPIISTQSSALNQYVQRFEPTVPLQSSWPPKLYLPVISTQSSTFNRYMDNLDIPRKSMILPQASSKQRTTISTTTSTTTNATTTVIDPTITTRTTEETPASISDEHLKFRLNLLGSKIRFKFNWYVNDI